MPGLGCGRCACPLCVNGEPCGLQHSQVLVTVGVEEPGITSATLKTWDLSRIMASASSSSGSGSLTPSKQHKVGKVAEGGKTTA